MKTIKILFVAIFAVGLGFAVSAFQTSEKEAAGNKAPVTEGWFRLVNPSAPDLASSYEYESEVQPCDGESALCSIKATIVPNSIYPHQDDVDAAKTASGDFAYPVTGMVAFEE